MRYNNFLIYRASAGTGKTFSLVKEYLSVVLKEPDKFGHTLAITFTNKASEEMKSRILYYLHNIADGSNDEGMLSALQQNTGLSRETLIKNAQIVLTNILHNYASFSVGTIDSFSNVIVQTFAREMQLPANYELELTPNDIIAEAVDDVVAQTGEDKMITDILTRFVKQQIEGSKHTDITRELNTFAQEMLSEDGIMQRNRLAQFDTEELKEKEKFISQTLKDYESEILRLAKPVWESIKHLQQAFYQGTKGIPGFFKKLADDPFLFQKSLYAQQTIEEGKWFSGKATVAEKLEIEALQKNIEDAYEQITGLQEKSKTKIVLFGLIRKNMFSMMLLNEINRVIIAKRDESGIVHISELNKKIADVIDKDPVPFIYERIGERYKNYLIDEFQDTSLLQWHNFIPLILNSLSENGLSMIVGDGKQAIYRWRSGDVEQFERLSALDEQPPQNENEAFFKRHLELQHLKQNFRSDKAIVDFNNRLFEFAKRYIPDNYDELKNVYSDLSLDALPSKQQGFVSIRFISESEKVTYQESMSEAVSAKIEQLLDNGFSRKDIAVLCRSNKSTSLLAQYLLQKEIPVASSDSLMIASSDTVNLVVAALNYMAIPDASNCAIFWIQLLKTKNMPWDDHVMERINKLNSCQFQNVLHQAGYDILFHHIESMTLVDAAIELIAAFKINKEQDLHLRFFIDGLIDAQVENILMINDFGKWWEKKGKNQSLVISDDTDAVKVMTIHKAKGLGFPVVIYAFADEEFKKSTNNIWIDLDPEHYYFPAALLPLNKQLQETDFEKLYREEEAKSVLDLLNILYVACTRPKKELYIFSQNKEIWKNDKCSVPDIFQSFLVSENLWEPDKSEYIFGVSLEKKEKTTALLIEKQEQHDIPIIPWYERISISSHAQRYWTNNHAGYGNMIHNILEKIETAASIKPALQHFLTSGIITTNDNLKIEPVLNNIVQHPDLKLFFDANNKILCEASILLPEHQEFRPDRIVIKDGVVHLLDYKTGEQHPEHEKQIKNYVDIFLRMNYQVASAKLVYLNEENITVVDVKLC